MLQEIPWIDIHTHRIHSPEGEINIFNLTMGKDDVIVKPVKGLFSVGLHPWFIASNQISEMKETILRLAQDKWCVAIGETGLDKLIHVPLTRQLEVFQWHIELAMSLQKPIVIHCVRAFQEVIEELRKMKFPHPVIFHGFVSKPQLAAQISSIGYYLSFGERSFRNPDTLTTTLSQVKNHRFFLETDDSEQSIVDLYIKAAQVTLTDLMELKKIIFHNFQECFSHGMDTSLLDESY